MKKVNCVNCGAKLEEPGKYCSICGTFQDNEDENEKKTVTTGTGKSKLAAGLLGIFFGGLGIHNFYLGYTTKGIIQILMSTLGSPTLVAPIAAHLWGFIEGIMILCGSIKEDANGESLRD